MSFLRLGTRVAVINDAEQILLSKRGDFNTWALPGGRVDNHERIRTAAVREVEEETGLQVDIERAVGLYYQAGRDRLNVLYRAKPIGGTLHSVTHETLANQYFALTQLPPNIFGEYMMYQAYADDVQLHTLETSRRELWRVRAKLAQRWVSNWLSGQPEATFPRFYIKATATIWDSNHKYIYSDRDGQGGRTLPRVGLDGTMAPQSALTYHLAPLTKEPMHWRWIGLFEHPEINEIEFVFETAVKPRRRYLSRWVKPAAIKGAGGRDSAYLTKHKRHKPKEQPVWEIAIT
jgi:ADP-ribose pyrophosphatase YjhB (NUDIX family)